MFTLYQNKKFAMKNLKTKHLTSFIPTQLGKPFSVFSYFEEFKKRKIIFPN